MPLSASPSQPLLPTAVSRHLKFYKYMKYYVPIFGWLPNYSIQNDLRLDLISGLTVATLLIPQSLSYAQALIHIPPVHGNPLDPDNN